MKTRDITFPAVGIALFVALSMCLRVPVFENYYLCLGYIVMTVYIWCFKWYDGAIVGFFGVILYCVVGSLGFNGMPGWSVGNVVIGLILGLALKPVKGIKSKALQVAATAAVAVVATFVGILLVKSLIDSVVVAQPFVVRFGKNMTSFIADAFVIVASLPICALVEDQAKKLRYK
jgi:uncharacterized membrane protein